MKPKIICVFLAILTILTSCKLDPSVPYTFRQSAEHVAQIDVLKQTNEKAAWDQRFTLVATLNDSQHDNFINSLVSITGQNFFNPPPTSFDLYVFRIIYADGEEEYISGSNNGYRFPGGEIQLDTYWFSDKESFNALVSQYVGYDISDEIYAWNRRGLS